MHGVCAQAKDKLKKVKKASSELCDGVAEIKVSATLQKRLTTVHSISMCSGNVRTLFLVRLYCKTVWPKYLPRGRIKIFLPQ